MDIQCARCKRFIYKILGRCGKKLVLCFQCQMDKKKEEEVEEGRFNVGRDDKCVEAECVYADGCVTIDEGETYHVSFSFMRNGKEYVDLVENPGRTYYASRFDPKEEENTMECDSCGRDLSDTDTYCGDCAPFRNDEKDMKFDDDKIRDVISEGLEGNRSVLLKKVDGEKVYSTSVPSKKLVEKDGAYFILHMMVGGSFVSFPVELDEIKKEPTMADKFIDGRGVVDGSCNVYWSGDPFRVHFSDGSMAEVSLDEFEVMEDE